MKKLNSLVFYALVAPVVALGAGTVLAQQPVDKTSQSDLNKQHAMQTEAQKEIDRKSIQGKTRMQNSDYLGSVPANGAHASHLIGADVQTANNEDIGDVSDLIIGSDGQVMAIVVSVGGFLGMGEKDVAIGWDHIKRSGTADDMELRVDVTRDELKAAPTFTKRD
ncbi:MAG TPA: PRC-barrel domain-containing protein [Rheinheimera sp.]|nr:PRC-barrel domain-containing protein [Rheinheimera sp.]